MDLGAVTSRCAAACTAEAAKKVAKATPERARRDTASHAGSGLSATTAGVTAADSIEYAYIIAASIGAGSAGTPEGQTLLAAASPTPAAPVGHGARARTGPVGG